MIWSFVGLGNLKYVNDANGAALGRPFYTYFMHIRLSLSLLLSQSLCACVRVSLYLLQRPRRISKSKRN